MIQPKYESHETVTRAVTALIRRDRSAPIILCVGSDRITGDSLGPLTGYLLTDKYNVAAFVYGTLDHPVTAKNLVETVTFIKSRHPYDKILAIDAALGKVSDIGVIKINKGGLEPGSALNRNLPKVGDYSVTAIVAGFTQGESVFLQDIRLNLVYRLAETVALGVSESIGVINRGQSFA